MPDRKIKSWHAGLIHSGNVWGKCKSLRCGDSVGFDVAITQLRKCIRGLVEHKIDLPCD